MSSPTGRSFSVGASEGAPGVGSALLIRERLGSRAAFLICADRTAGELPPCRSRSLREKLISLNSHDVRSV